MHLQVAVLSNWSIALPASSVQAAAGIVTVVKHAPGPWLDCCVAVLLATGHRAMGRQTCSWLTSLATCFFIAKGA